MLFHALAVTDAEAGADYSQAYTISLLVPKLCGRKCHSVSTFPRCSFLPFFFYLEHNCIFSTVFCIFLQCGFHFSYSLFLIGSRDSLDSPLLNFSVCSHLQDGQGDKRMHDFEERDNIMLEEIYCIGYFWQPRQISKQSRQGKYCLYQSGPVLEYPDLTEPFLHCVQTLTSSNQTLLQAMKYCLSTNIFSQYKIYWFLECY